MTADATATERLRLFTFKDEEADEEVEIRIPEVCSNYRVPHTAAQCDQVQL